MQRDIADQMEHLASVSAQKGCNIWLCMVTPDLKRAAREIRKLRAELERLAEPNLFKQSGDSNDDRTTESEPHRDQQGRS